LIESVESALLSCILQDGTKMLEVVDSGLSPQHFESLPFRLMYKSVLALHRSGVPISVITVRDHMLDVGSLESAGGEAAIHHIGLDLPDPHAFPSFIETIKGRAITRSVFEMGQRLVDIREQGLSADEVLARCSGLYEQVIDNSRLHTQGTTAEEGITALVEDVKEGIKPGLATGFQDLNDILYGLCPGKVYVIAGRPGMGKTALAGNMVAHIGESVGGRIAMFSLEMGVQELMLRWLSDFVNIPANRIKQGTLQKSEWQKLEEAKEAISKWKLVIDDGGILSVDRLAARVKHMKLESQGLDLVVVDYLQLMDMGRGNKNDEIGRITARTKQLAKEVDVPVIMISQLSRAPENRPDKRPTLPDLRESGAIEQDADVVMFVFREGAYKAVDDTGGVTDLIVAKNRAGATGVIKMRFHPEITRFTRYY